MNFLALNYKSFKDMGDKLGGIFSLHLFHKHFIVLNDWRVMEEALVGQSEVFSSRPEMLFSKAMISVEDILFIDGPVWKEKRRFTIHHLRNFGAGKTMTESAITEEVSKVSDILQRHIGQPLEINDLFFLPVLNVLWRIIGGKTYDDDNDDEIKQFAAVIKDTFARGWESIGLNFFPFPRWFTFNLFHTDELAAAIKKVVQMITIQVDEHQRTLQKDEPRDYMDAYLAEIENKTDKIKDGDACYHKSHLIGAIFDMFNAGVETTATTLEWALLYMAIWPEIQRKVQEELDTVIGRSRQPKYSDNLELPYTRATLMEVQRYCTVIPLCSPRVAAVTTQLAGYTIKKGAIVIQNLWAVHHDKAYWDEPEVFRPSRFLNEHDQVKKFENLIPFSTGPRVCLGESLARMELFLFFACLLHTYSFHCPTGRELPSLEPVQTLTLHPKSFKLTIKPRSH